MAALLSGKQQLVVLALKRGSWISLFKTGAGWDFSAGSPRLFVIKEVQSTAEPMMVLDAQIDDRLKEHRYSPFRSALCLPVVKPWGVAGLVFVEEPERAQAFSHHQLGPWKELTDQLAETITAEPTQLEMPVLTPRMAAGVGVAVLGSMLLGWLLKAPPAPPKPPPKIVVIKPQDQTPEEVSNGFLGALNLGRYDVAYLMLKPDLRKSVSQKVFEDKMRRWLSQPGFAEEAVRRQAEVGKMRPGIVTIAVVRPNSSRDAWRWTLIKDPEGWRFDRLPGK